MQFKERLDFLFDEINSIKGLSVVHKPCGAFYLSTSCYVYFGKYKPDSAIIKNANDFASYLLEFTNVAIALRNSFW